MAKTPEGKVKDRLVKHLKDKGIYYFFPATHGYGRSGVPDVIACYEGLFLAFECKATKKKKPTALQEKELLAIDCAEGFVMVVHDENVDRVPQHIDVWLHRRMGRGLVGDA